MQIHEDKSTDQRVPVYTVFHHLSDDLYTYLPLALGMITAYAKAYKNGFLDNLFEFIPLSDCSLEEIQQAHQNHGPGVWLFSNYTWNMHFSLKISQSLKGWNERNITIHGGPNVPAREQDCLTFLKENRHVDIAARGEGEILTAELLEHFIQNELKDSLSLNTLEKIQGISYLSQENDNQLIRTPDRPRILNLEELPSPYVNGIFDHPHYKVNEHHWKNDGVLLMTNRGCPYQCTFCDWGSLTQQKIKSFGLDQIKAEIEWAAKRQFTQFEVCDANFGILKRDVEIAKLIAQAKKRYGFPKEVNMSLTKNGSKRLAEIMKIFDSVALNFPASLSIQTRDEETLKIVKRSNIKSSHYDDLQGYFKQEQIPVLSELILGLPGATIESLKKDIQYYHDRNVTLRIYPARLLINSPMADPEYIERYKIIVNQNDIIQSTHSYSKKDFQEMKLIAKLYKLFIRYALLKYVLRYLEWEHCLSFTDFLDAFLKEIKDETSSKLQFTKYLLKMSGSHATYLIIAQNKERFFEEMKAFIGYAFDIRIEPCFNLVCDVNQSVIPSPNNVYPFTIELEHDFSQYYLDSLKNNRLQRKKLNSYPCATLEVSDPEGFQSRLSKATLKHSPSPTIFELRSPLSLECYRV